MSKAIRIIKWDEYHENAESRKVRGPLTWIRVPCSFDTMGLRVLLDMKDGVAAFGVYVILAELAGTCPVRGILANENGVFDVKKISLRTGIPKLILNRSISILMSDEIKWIEFVEPKANPVKSIPSGFQNPVEPQSAGMSQDIREEEKKRGREEEGKNGRKEESMDEIIHPSSSPANRETTMFQAWSDRIGHDPSSFAVSKLVRLKARCNDTPIMLDGKPVDGEDVMIAAIRTIKPDCRTPIQWINSVVDRALLDGVMPGEPMARDGPPAKPPKPKPWEIKCVITEELAKGNQK